MNDVEDLKFIQKETYDDVEFFIFQGSQGFFAIKKAKKPGEYSFCFLDDSIGEAINTATNAIDYMENAI